MNHSNTRLSQGMNQCCINQPSISSLLQKHNLFPNLTVELQKILKSNIFGRHKTAFFHKQGDSPKILNVGKKG